MRTMISFDEQERYDLYSSPGHDITGVFFEAGIASSFAHSLIIFHSRLRIVSLITFFSYSGSYPIKPTQKAPLAPPHLPVLLLLNVCEHSPREWNTGQSLLQLLAQCLRWMLPGGSPPPSCCFYSSSCSSLVNLSHVSFLIKSHLKRASPRVSTD